MNSLNHQHDLHFFRFQAAIKMPPSSSSPAVESNEAPPKWEESEKEESGKDSSTEEGSEEASSEEDSHDR